MTDTSPPSLHWRVPGHVWAAVAVFLCLQLLVVCNLRGPADPELYPLDASKHVPVNAYEDDGAINVAATLNLIPPTDRFSSLINIGGPYLLGARAFVRLAGALGFVRCFHDPWLYAVYPREYHKVWVAVGIYKLLVFLPFFPLVLYWIGRNHLSGIAGGLAAWMVALLPFLTGFEARLKTDSPAMILGFFALLYLLHYPKSGRRRHLLAAAGLLGASMAMKFLMVPGLAVLGLVVLRRWRTRDGGGLRRVAADLLFSGLAFTAAFVAANPLVVPGTAAFLTALFTSKVFVTVTTAPQAPGLVSTLADRVARLEVFFGPWLGALALPALVIELAGAAHRRRLADARGLLLVFFAVNAVYLYVVAPTVLAIHTYYFLQPALVAALLLADVLAGVLVRVQSRPVVGVVVPLAVAGLYVLTAREDLAVLACMTAPSNRQAAHAFLTAWARVGDSVGIPIAPGEETFSRAFGVDPFRFRLRKIGQAGEDIARYRPDWIVRIRHDPAAAWPTAPGYAPLARFWAGAHLPHERFDLYQEVQYGLDVRGGEGGAQASAPVSGPERGGAAGEAEPAMDVLYALGELVRADPEPAFNLLQAQALPLRPISLDLLRKAGDTVLPQATNTFGAAVRDPSSPLAYVHQLDRTTLALWGVKYLLAKDDDATFARETRDSGRFDLELAARLPGGVAAYRNKDYRGQAFFFADPPVEAARRKLSPRFFPLRHPQLPYGSLYSRADLAASGVKLLAVTVRLDASGPVDVLLKGGTVRRSLLAGPGYHEFIAPYEVGDGPEDVGYELNPVHPDTRVVLDEIAAAPLDWGQGGRLEAGTVTPRAAFARVAADVPGRVGFALSFVPGLFAATVDGVSVPVHAGPAGIVAVAVPAGRHFVAVTVAR